MSNDEEVRHYLRAAAALEKITLDEVQLDRLTVVFARNLELARTVLAFPLDVRDELAPVYRSST